MRRKQKLSASAIPHEDELRRIAHEQQVPVSSLLAEAIGDFLRKEELIHREARMIYLAEREKM
jgi:hypothetical protein